MYEFQFVIYKFITSHILDPDNRHRDVPYNEWHHWLVGNIPGNDVASGEVLSAYIGSGPPQGTGIHRYVFIVYKQPSKLKFNEPRLQRQVNYLSEVNQRKFC